VQMMQCSCNKHSAYIQLPDINTIGLQSQTRYNVAKVLHEKLALQYFLLNESTPHCKYNPSKVLENNLTQYWDKGIQINVLHNHSDITLFEKSNNIVYLIAVSIQNLGNKQTAYITKLGKYAEVSTEVQQQWLVEAVYYLPVTISATGVIFTLHDVLQLLDLLALLHMTIQKDL